MTWTQEDRDNLARAIATGAKRVKFQTHEVEYRTMQEMRDLLTDMDTTLNPNSATPRRTVARFNSGF